MECCSAGLLMSNGDVVELERCDCTLAQDRDCGANGTNRLLTGFEDFRCAVCNGNRLLTHCGLWTYVVLHAWLDHAVHIACCFDAMTFV